ncbi:hypothetical protein CN449_15240 [Bacillus thuringiensis]|uniref:hypothetical protein n=1 Tax=Bacillus thuringiensis TaxID=1428 RepID=UPI000BF5419F|nr:hypothetical protein [Bacillus thuringiensis]PEW74018.1 hypothetical protein CN449_15240 [Bacillus thuringiensis]PFD32544.1 hypothetical protein CN269_04345 [Bacillus thuringiensis]
MDGFYIKKDGKEANASVFVDMLVKLSAKMIPYLSLGEFEKVLEVLTDEELEEAQKFLEALDRGANELRKTNEHK